MTSADSQQIITDQPARRATGRPFRPGPDPRRNTRGRPKAGAVYEEWMNALADRSAAHLRAILDDEENEPVMKVAAARDLMDARRDGYFNATPLRANPLDRILDRTVGRPTQRVEVSRDEPDPNAVLSTLSAILARRPDLAQRVMGALPREIVAEVLPESRNGDDAVERPEIDSAASEHEGG